jgi:hypothetical protein
MKIPFVKPLFRGAKISTRYVINHKILLIAYSSEVQISKIYF